MRVLLHSGLSDAIFQNNPRTPLPLPVPWQKTPSPHRSHPSGPMLPLWSDVLQPGHHPYMRSLHWYFTQLIRNIYTPKTFKEGHIQPPHWSR